MTGHSEFALEKRRTWLTTVLGFILAITIFFPEIGVIRSMDVQPNFFIIATLAVATLVARIRLSKTALLFFLTCLFCLWVSFTIHNDNVNEIYILKYTVGLVSIFFCYILCSNNIITVSQKFILIVASIYIVVAAIQFKFPNFFVFLVTRDITTSDLLSSGRGMLSLTGEPSHFGKTLTILNILFVFKVLTEVPGKRNSVSPLKITFILFLSNCIFAQSFYACFFHFICLLGIYFIYYPKVALTLMIFLFFTVVSIISFLEVFFPEERITTIAGLAITNPELLLEQGAMARVLNIPLTFVNLSHFGIWGAGNSSAVVPGQFGLGFGVLEYEISSRLYGGFIELFLKQGILIIPLFIGYVFCFVKIAGRKYIWGDCKRRGSYIIAAMLFMLSIQDGSPASPLMIFAVIYVFVQSSRLPKIYAQEKNKRMGI